MRWFATIALFLGAVTRLSADTFVYASMEPIGIFSFAQVGRERTGRLGTGSKPLKPQSDVLASPSFSSAALSSAASFGTNL